MINYFERCQHCVPPERHPGCQDRCEHYAEAKAKYEADKVKLNGNVALRNYIKNHNAAHKDSTAKYKKRRP